MNYYPDLTGVRIVRVLTVSSAISTHLSFLLRAFSQCGSNQSVISSGLPTDDFMKSIESVDYHNIYIPRKISLIYDLYALYKLYRFFRNHKVQIVHSITPKAGFLAAIAGYFANTPIRLHTFTGQPWVNMIGLKRRLVFWSDVLVCKLNTLCYADSPHQRQFLIEQGVGNSDQIKCIGYGSLFGVDINRFNSKRFSPDKLASKRASLGISDNAIVLLYVGRLTSEKGVRELLKAFTLLNSDFMDLHLILVGDIDIQGGGLDYLSFKLINEKPNIHWCGFSNFPDEFMSIAHILCLPSYREGFGTVVIEAAAMGIPTVGSNIYGLKDAIVDEVTGLLVPPGNSDQLFRALRRLIVDDKLRRKLGNAARVRAIKKFDSNYVTSEMIKEYVRILDLSSKIQHAQK